MAALRADGAARLHRRRQARRQRRDAPQGAAVPAHGRRRPGPPRGGPALSGAGAMHEGTVSALLGVAGIPSISESTMVARDCAIAGVRGRARAHAAPAARASPSRAVAHAKQAGVQVTCEACPAPPRRSPTRRSGPRHAHEDEPAAARRERPPGADRRACATARSTASRPTTRRTRATRRRSRSSRRRWGRRGWRPRSPRVHTELVRPRRAAARARRREADGGGGLLGLPVPRDRARARRANLVLVDLEATWEVGRDGLRVALGELLLRGPAPPGPRPAHRRGRVGRLPRARASR